MTLQKLILLSVVLLIMVGCGRSGKPVQAPTASPAEAAKAALKEVADTGVVGSGMLTVRENLEKIQKEDAAKGAALLKEFEALEKARSPQEVQMRARQLMSKL